MSSTTWVLSACFCVFLQTFFVNHVNCVSHFCGVCSCWQDSQHNLVVDCSGRGLTSIPKLPEATVKLAVKLDLSKNKIQTLPENCFVQYSRLETIDLSGNSLQSFVNTSFLGLHELRFFNLGQNNLNLTQDVLIPGFFRDLKQLQLLNLQDNNYFPDSATSICPFCALRDLAALNTLLLNPKVENFVLGEEFRSLMNLRDLHFVCATEVLRKSTFRNLFMIERLFMNTSSINKIEAGTFQPMVDLVYLDISSDETLGTVCFKNVTYGLSATNIKVLNITQLISAVGLGYVVKSEDLINLQNSSLEEISMQKSRIEAFEFGALGVLPMSIRILTLEHNRFTVGKYIFELALLPNLSQLYIGFNDRYVPMRKVNTTVRFNGSHSFREKEISSLSNFFPLPTKLELISAPNMNLEAKLSLNVSLPTNIVHHLDISGNFICPLAGHVSNVRDLMHLDLSYNYCSDITYQFLSSFPNLQTLKLSGNMLGDTLRMDADGKYFSKFRKLTSLILRNNQIMYLPKTIFKGLVNLEELDLSDNILSLVDFDIGMSNSLNNLNVSRNQQTMLPKSVRDHLSKVSTKHNVTVDLTNNPILCTCGSADFFIWILSVHNIAVISSTLQSCTDADGRTRHVENMQELLTFQQKFCPAFVGTISVLVASVLAVLLLIASRCTYRHRWTIQYWRFKRRLKDIRQLKYEGQHAYDAYVSFDEIDREFVLGRMVGKFETEWHMKLFISERDICPGMMIRECIFNAIRNSGKFITVLSSSYIESDKNDETKFESIMGRLEEMKECEKFPFRFVIALETIPTEKLPMEIKEVTMSGRYIDLSRDEDTSWRKILGLLNHKRL